MEPTRRTNYLAAAGWLIALTLVALTGSAEAGQGCPFDDGSCREYCGQQGCQLGYCGHFAWIQCICRKCGDEWSWYDKVRYEPNKQVNQTELDSLKLNGTGPLILSKGSGEQQQVVAAGSGSQRPVAEQRQQQTLTTLLIPDLSDASKVDPNEIPDENSEKFLDYLAKNHEKLVQATSIRQQATGGAGEEEEEEPAPGAAPTTQQPLDDQETVEIQISSSNNNQQQQQQQQQVAGRGPGEKLERGPTMRLLRMAAVGEESFE